MSELGRFDAFELHQPNGRNRRILSVPGRSGGGRLSERTPAVRPRRREWVKVPHSGHVRRVARRVLVRAIRRPMHPFFNQRTCCASIHFFWSIRAGGRRTTRPRACALRSARHVLIRPRLPNGLRIRWRVTVRGAAPAPSLRPAACRRSGSGSGRIAALPGMTASRPPP